MSPFLGNPSLSDVVGDPGTKWLRKCYDAQKAEGLTDLGWAAWCREIGVIVSGNPTGWDDIRRVSVMPLSSVGITVGEDGGSPGAGREPIMAKITPITDEDRKRRPYRRRHRRRAPGRAA